jgi:hypothetical protein
MMPPDTASPSREEARLRVQPTCIFALALALITGHDARADALPAPSEQPLTVTAKHITFYSDQYVVQADGNVNVALADGAHLSGNTFAMDLKLDRFVLAGDVHLVTPDGKDIPGAAFAKFFDFDRAYFIPIIEKPDRWTYLGSDYAHPLPGREMPGDTFFLHDLRQQHVFLYATKARIVPLASVAFTPANVNLDPTNSAAVYVPTPGYFLNFSPNPNFAQNGLAGADFDAPYPFAGSAHTLAAAHVRYDPLNHVYLALEQHLAITDRSYLVLSANPLTRPQKEYNLLALDRISPKIQTQLFMQENAFQFGLSEPHNAEGFAQLQATAGLHQSFLQLSADQYWDSLLAGSPCSSADCAWIPDHPSDAQLSWTGFDHLIARALYLRLRSGVGFAHNSQTPEQTLEGAPYPTIWQHFVGFTAYTPSLPLKNPPFRNWYVNAVLDKGRQWFSSPHYIDTTSTTVSASKTFDRHFSGFISVNVTNMGDYYGALQSMVYKSTEPTSTIVGQIYPGYKSFRGIETTRSLTESVIWTPSAAFTLSVTGRENHDFPEPIPYLTALPAYGPPSASAGTDIGVAPEQLSFDMHVRVNSNLLIDLTRSYYFNYGNRRWSPQFGVLITR